MVVVDKGTDPQTGVDLKLAAVQEQIDYSNNKIVIIYNRLFYRNDILISSGRSGYCYLTGSEATAYIAMSVEQRNAEITTLLTAVE